MQASDLTVTKTDSSGSVATLTLNVHYTVTGAGSSSGGSVSLISGNTCASGYTITITRNTELTQEDDYVDGEAFSAESLESALDKTTLTAQDLARRVWGVENQAAMVHYVATPNMLNYSTAIGVKDIKTKGPWVDVRAFPDSIHPFGNISTAKVYAEAQGKPLLIGTAVTSNNLTINTDVQMLRGGLITIAPSTTVTFNKSFSAGSNRVFSASHSYCARFGKGAIIAANPQWWGLSETATAAANFLAIKSAIDSYAPTVQLPNGAYSYDTTIEFDRSVIFKGAGSLEQGFVTAGVSTTTLSYTGTATAMILNGIVNYSLSNVHLSDFMLTGTASAGGGISIGNSTPNAYVTHSSIRNVAVNGFSNVSTCGLRLQRVLESTVDNVSLRNNNYGLCSLPGDVATIVTVNQVHTYTNSRFGTYLNPSLIYGSTFNNLINESNDHAGMSLNGLVQATAFNSYYSEDNCRTTIGTCQPLEIGLVSTGVTNVQFNGGVIADATGTPSLPQTPSISMDNARAVIFHDLMLEYYTGDITITANTTECEYKGAYSNISLDASMVTGNHFNGVMVNGSRSQTLADSAAADIGIKEGIFSVARKNTTAGGIVNGSVTGTSVGIVADALSVLSTTKDTGSKINVYYESGALMLQNKLGDAYTFIIRQ
jgi:hypothetical protein